MVIFDSDCQMSITLDLFWVGVITVVHFGIVSPVVCVSLPWELGMDATARGEINA
jgi:hypothetical protein